MVMGKLKTTRHYAEINPNRNKFDVACDCGWRSTAEPTRHSAVLLAHLHIVESCLHQGA